MMDENHSQSCCLTASSLSHLPCPCPLGAAQDPVLKVGSFQLIVLPPRLFQKECLPMSLCLRVLKWVTMIAVVMAAGWCWS